MDDSLADREVTEALRHSDSSVAVRAADGRDAARDDVSSPLLLLLDRRGAALSRLAAVVVIAEVVGGAMRLWAVGSWRRDWAELTAALTERGIAADGRAEAPGVETAVEWEWEWEWEEEGEEETSDRDERTTDEAARGSEGGTEADIARQDSSWQDTPSPLWGERAGEQSVSALYRRCIARENKQ